MKLLLSTLGLLLSIGLVVASAAALWFEAFWLLTVIGHVPPAVAAPGASVVVVLAAVTLAALLWWGDHRGKAAGRSIPRRTYVAAEDIPRGAAVGVDDRGKLRLLN